jgi:uncharacterized protein
VRATAPAERIEAIDILRGLALFGVLVVNLVGSFRDSFLQHFLYPDPSRALPDRIADAAIRMALEGKALTIFAFLFGAGLAMQYERLARSHEDPARLLRRRLLVLLGFGLAHLLLVWNGDILTEYALLGLAALALLHAPEERLRQWMAGLLALSLLTPALVMGFLFPDEITLRREMAQADDVYAFGSWLEIRAYSLREFGRLTPVLITLLPQTLAIFLAGIIAWRRGYLAQPDAHLPTLRRLAAIGLGVGGALTLFNQLEPDTLASLAMAVTLPLAPLLLAMGYAAGLMLVLRSARTRQALAAFGDLGRMAFTNYVVQSLVFGFIFFGYGLGLFGQLGTVAALAMGVAFYVLQLAYSRAWLARYRYGPLEWAWRSLTYGERQPMRR